VDKGRCPGTSKKIRFRRFVDGVATWKQQEEDNVDGDKVGKGERLALSELEEREEKKMALCDRYD